MVKLLAKLLLVFALGFLVSAGEKGVDAKLKTCTKSFDSIRCTKDMLCATCQSAGPDLCRTRCWAMAIAAGSRKNLTSYKCSTKNLPALCVCTYTTDKPC
ncbi:hypothetical protein CASFOL_037919 [Castilleja foliolosa]|uniref:Uncharacterized protein n=1 Tax=Castilleja foliolosa TaxID=1961234 RepID=A0ABD3BK54_9LAMI